MTKAQFNKFFKNFKYLEHEFEIRFLPHGFAMIDCNSNIICVDTGDKAKFHDHRKLGYVEFNEFELLNYMRNWMMNLAIHENDERIMYKGKKIFNPHKVWSHIMEL
jgi:hypothetical protein